MSDLNLNLICNSLLLYVIKYCELVIAALPMNIKLSVILILRFTVILAIFCYIYANLQSTLRKQQGNMMKQRRRKRGGSAKREKEKCGGEGRDL